MNVSDRPSDLALTVAQDRPASGACEGLRLSNWGLDVDKLKLLLVEDDPDERQLIRETLAEHFAGSTIAEAASGTAALRLDLRSFDLILCDYHLPDCSGMDLLEKIQKLCSTPTILVTGQNVGQLAAEAVRRGAVDYVVKFGDYLFTIPLVVEKNLMVAKIVRENNRLRDQLEHALHEVRDKNAQLESSLQMVEQLAATDPLTCLYNRRHFGRVLEQLFSESERLDSELSCVMIDMDDYKQINDTLGHVVGDQLLSLAGKIVLANMRKMDVAARYGGDELVLLLPHATAEEAATVAARIADEFRQGSAILLRRTNGVTMSQGIASRTRSAPAAAPQLVAHADTALYAAKKAGRNRLVIHEPTALEARREPLLAGLAPATPRVA